MNLRTTITYYNRIIEVKKIIGRGDRLLNIGCGIGNFNYYLKDDYKDVYGVDINAHDIWLAKQITKREKNLHYKEGSIYKIPYDNNYFDGIICTETLEHVRDMNKALTELRRVLKKNGRLVITVPVKNFPITYDLINKIRINNNKRPMPFGAYGFGHKVLYTSEEYESTISKYFMIKESSLISFGLIGCIENYIPSIVTRLIKTNHDNKSSRFDKSKSKERPDKIDFNIPGFLQSIYRTIIYIDNRIFKSKNGINLILLCRK